MNKKKKCKTRLWKITNTLIYIEYILHIFNIYYKININNRF